MKHEIFISYSHEDYDKVELIIKELESHPTLKPLVIANNREAGKLLAEKVMNGIKNTNIIVPIITENSIKEQWINQEIGYATALNKKMVPIIDKELIDTLKGFVHKQIDLPYTYNKPSYIGRIQKYNRRELENKEFIERFKILINDIEKGINDTDTGKAADASLINISSGLKKTEMTKFLHWKCKFSIEESGFTIPIFLQEIKTFFTTSAGRHLLPVINNFYEPIIDSQSVLFSGPPTSIEGIGIESQVKLTKNEVWYEFAYYSANDTILTNLYYEVGGMLALLLFIAKLRGHYNIKTDINCDLNTNATILFNLNPYLYHIYSIVPVIGSFECDTKNFPIVKAVNGITSNELADLVESFLLCFVCKKPVLPGGANFLTISKEEQFKVLESIKKNLGVSI